jgi:hypothetical protein
MFSTTNNDHQNQNLQDLDLVPPSTIDVIFAAVMRGDEKVKESFLFRRAHSNAEFYASCEFAENIGLNVCV